MTTRARGALGVLGVVVLAAWLGRRRGGAIVEKA
jgi:hypothetical protein